MQQRVGFGALVAGVLLAAGVASADTTLDRTVTTGTQTPYANLVEGPGDPITVRTDLATPKAGREQRRTSITYFAQLSDFQLADEESPARVEMLDQTNSVFSAAWRPQEALM